MNKLCIKEFARYFIEPECIAHIVSIVNPANHKKFETHLEICRLVVLLTKGVDDLDLAMDLHNSEESNKLFSFLDEKIGLQWNSEVSSEEISEYGRRLFERVWNDLVLV